MSRNQRLIRIMDTVLEVDNLKTYFFIEAGRRARG